MSWLQLKLKVCCSNENEKLKNNGGEKNFFHFPKKLEDLINKEFVN